MIASRRQLLIAGVAVICAFAATVQAQTLDTNPSKPTGVISGSVTSSSGDLPNNTTVYVSVVGADGPPRRAVLNSDGTFKIDNLDFGVYRVWAGAPGFVGDPQLPIAESRGIYHTGDSAHLTLRKGGVITGKVMSSNDGPVIAATIRAYRVRDENGKPIEVTSPSAERMTDDRGVYRMYGLVPGTYVVSAGGTSRIFSGYGVSAYDQDVPTYAPSSTRDTAQEVVVRSGDEAIADIQHRGESGRAISGTVVGIPPSQNAMNYGASVTLTDVKSRSMLTSAQASQFSNLAFVFHGLPDGEYELVAQQVSQSRDLRASQPKRVKVKGADITGLTLTVAPLPVIAGRIILDSSSAADCVRRRATAFQETHVNVRRQKRASKSGATEDADSSEPVPLGSLEQVADDVPDDKGDFILRNLRSGTYRLSVQVPSAAWYLRSVTLGASSKGMDSKVISDGIDLKSQSVSGLTITMSEGAAGIRGRLNAGEGQQLPAHTMVYLVPAEKENSTNLLRYFETRSATDGTFGFQSVPPGEYLVMTREGEADQRSGIVIRQDPSLRAIVTREAEKAKHSVTLKSCERIENYELPFPMPTKP